MVWEAEYPHVWLTFDVRKEREEVQQEVYRLCHMVLSGLLECWGDNKLTMMMMILSCTLMRDGESEEDEVGRGGKSLMISLECCIFIISIN